MSLSIEQLSETRQMILGTLKQNGPATIAELSSCLEMTREAIRQHLIQLEHEGWIGRNLMRDSGASGGRPSTCYSLTSEGDHLFPKHYDALTVEVLDTVADHLGVEALTQVLSKMTEARIREWETRLQGLNLGERVEALKEFYLEDDSYMEANYTGDELYLIEKNCPFLNVANRRPVVCSVTVSALTHLLGYKVIREERFQNGDGRCVFHVLQNEPNKEGTFKFTLES